jgi:capsular exopolysaccharide synthesis family protein
MSRIFDALQKSGLEGAGFEFPLASSLPPVAQAAEEDNGEFVKSDLEECQSLPISVSSEGRLVCLTDEASLGAEKFRFLAVRLRQLQQSRPLKKVLITSTIPEEGKSMVSANLALSLANRRHQKILLVEGDLRRPSLSTRLGLRRLPGLIEWLQGNLNPLTNVYRLEEAGLWVLPAGDLLENPLELMQSGRLATLMDQLTNWFDWILIDSPPVLPLADTSVWSRLADGVLVVVREGTSRKRELERGLRVLEPSQVLGVVLNSCSPSDEGNYYQHYRPIGTPHTL